MNQILAFLKQLDKQLHIAGCCIATFTMGYWLTPLVGLLLATALTAFATACFGVAKEVYDKQHPDKHTADPMDLAADAVGIAVGSFVLLAPMIFIEIRSYF